MELSCDAVYQWMQNILTAEHPQPLDPQLCAYIANNPICRGMLLVLAQQLSGLVLSPPTLTCETCLQAMPAFVETESQHGIASALLEYPGVWWHMWMCANCAENYLITAALHRDEQEGNQPSLASILQQARCAPEIIAKCPFSNFTELMHLSRDFLTKALAFPQMQLVTRGEDEDEHMVIVDETVADNHIKVSVRYRPEIWHVIVHVNPAPKGWLVVKVNEQQIEALFDDYGKAVIPDLPAALFSAPRGSDLVVGVRSLE